MALLTQEQRALKIRLRHAAHDQQVRLDAESKRLLNNATANISPLYKKLSALLNEAQALAWADRGDTSSLDAFKKRLLHTDLTLKNSAAIQKLLPTLTKHLAIRYKLHPLFLDAMKGNPERTEVFKELLGLTPPNILKEYI